MRRNFKILDQILPRNSCDYRHQSNYSRIRVPSRPHRARTLGYKNKNHMILVRARIRRGGTAPMIPDKSRTPSNIGKHRTRDIPLSKILAQRVSRKYPTLRVLNYYPIQKDGKYLYYQYIMYDPVQIGPVPGANRPKGWVFR